MLTVVSPESRPAIELVDQLRSDGADLSRCQFIARRPSGAELILVEHGAIAGCYPIDEVTSCPS